MKQLALIAALAAGVGFTVQAAELPFLGGGKDKDKEQPERPPASGATPAPEGAEVYFIEPRDGAELTSPFVVKFGLRNMGVAPAGVDRENTGHHHLLIDKPEVDYGKPLRSTNQIVHFGGGQTETKVELEPGRHKLQLLLGDFKHQPHDPPVKSAIITITVKE